MKNGLLIIILAISIVLLVLSIVYASNIYTKIALIISILLLSFKIFMKSEKGL